MPVSSAQSKRISRGMAAKAVQESMKAVRVVVSFMLATWL
jgi:hypothetical protein